MAHIEILKDQVVGWDIVHIPREGNELADALAKSVVTRQFDLEVLYE